MSYKVKTAICHLPYVYSRPGPKVLTLHVIPKHHIPPVQGMLAIVGRCSFPCIRSACETIAVLYIHVYVYVYVLMYIVHVCVIYKVHNLWITQCTLWALSNTYHIYMYTKTMHITRTPHLYHTVSEPGL